MKKKILIGAFIGIVLSIAIAFFWYVNDYYRATPEAVASMQSDEDVKVYRKGNLLIFEPGNRDIEMLNSEIGFIFYPGGKVDHKAYTPVVKEIARQGYVSMIVEMPFNLAVFAPNRAQEAIDAFPEISKWAIGGHSLGGSMAARYANNNRDDVDALIFWASYADINLTETNLAILSIYGTQDGLISLEKIDSTNVLLPETTVHIAVEGGNHANFGMYGEQSGDLAAGISVAEQHQIIIENTVDFLDSLNRDRLETVE